MRVDDDLIIEHLATTLSPNASTSVVTAIDNHYTHLDDICCEKASPRLYHNKHHLATMWNWMYQQERVTAIDAAFVVMHDFIYFGRPKFPGASEQASANSLHILKHWNKEFRYDEIAQLVVGILATANHTETQPGLDDRVQFWLDADLSALATYDWDTYKHNTVNIYKESGLEPHDWWKKRGVFLCKLGEREKLFYQNDKLTRLAQTNIESELGDLDNNPTYMNEWCEEDSLVYKK